MSRSLGVSLTPQPHLVHDGIQTLHQYPSIRHLLSNSPTLSSLSFPTITQLVAYDTGFAALSSTHQVYTWGDERYTPCLGREPTDDRYVHPPQCNKTTP
jgi:hypothetical protein